MSTSSPRPGALTPSDVVISASRGEGSIASASPRAAQLHTRRLVFVPKARHQLRRRDDALDRADPLACAPDVAPGLGPAAAGGKIHLAGLGLRQSVGIETGARDRGFQIVAVH